jgi:hypothetical protein
MVPDGELSRQLRLTLPRLRRPTQSPYGGNWQANGQWNQVMIVFSPLQ